MPFVGLTVLRTNCRSTAPCCGPHAQLPLCTAPCCSQPSPIGKHKDSHT